MSSIFQGDLSQLQNLDQLDRDRIIQDREPSQQAKTALDLIGAPISVELLKDQVVSRAKQFGDFINEAIDTEGANIPSLEDVAPSDDSSLLGTVASRVRDAINGVGDSEDAGLGSRFLDALSSAKNYISEAIASRGQQLANSAVEAGQNYVSLDPSDLTGSISSRFSNLTGEQSSDFADLVAGRPTAAPSLPDDLFNRAMEIRDSLMSRQSAIRAPDEVNATFHNPIYEGETEEVAEPAAQLLGRVQQMVENAGSAGDSTIARALGQGANMLRDAGGTVTDAVSEAARVGEAFQSQLASNASDIAEQTGLSIGKATEALGSVGEDIAGSGTEALAGASAAGDALLESDNPIGAILGLITVAATAGVGASKGKEIRLPNLSRPFITEGLGGVN